MIIEQIVVETVIVNVNLVIVNLVNVVNVVTDAKVEANIKFS